MRVQIFFVCMFLSLSLLSQNKAIQKEAGGVIERLMSGKRIPLKLSFIDKQNDCDVFETEVKDGTLEIKGSSGVALCRGFYDYMKVNQYGMVSWSGKRVEFPERLPESASVRKVSPFVFHYYFNVVTYGYSMPYWDWVRWEQEIDWMALHGINMPLALVANEAISARVWKKMGLTDEEIAAYFTGPAHLPWMRMGNLCQIDGPLPEEWHKEQIRLQHKVLKRMKALGMNPVCPGFAGFVPQAIKRIHPEVELVETSWGGKFKNWMLSPEEKLFREMGRMFVEEWEKEFGKNDHYIVDSFNEMEIPFPAKGTPERYDLLASYGENVYQAIREGNPDAVWVMQGWMFGYQRNIWDYETLGALVSKVPDDKMLLLDLAVDYSKLFWNNGANWEFYKGFYNKPWVYSVIPNMGGKTGFTGVLPFYANGHLDALRSADKGRLVGHGFAPEGIENNEVIYELLSDAGWSDREIDTDQWLAQYAACRYAKSPVLLDSVWAGLQKSVYGGFTDHPRYNWQFRPGMVNKGSINYNDDFFRAVEAFVACCGELMQSTLYRSDVSEMTALYLGAKLDILVRAVATARLYEENEKVGLLEKQFEELMTGMDRILESHPTLRLQRWIDFARKGRECEAQKDYYEKNARRIVTIWGPPVDDYSARIWSGLIRDYYLPRWKQYFECQRTGSVFNPSEWERNWVEREKGVSVIEPYPDVVVAARELIGKASAITEKSMEKKGEIVGTWSPADIKTEWTEIRWSLPADKMARVRGVRFKYVRGSNKLDIREVILQMDGKEICRQEHEGTTGVRDVNNVYKLIVPEGTTGNNECLLRAWVRTDGRGESYGNVELVLSE